LVNAIQQAAADQDAERVAELTGLFRTVVADGLVPTLADAKHAIPPGSPDAERLGKVRESSVNDLSQLKAAVSATSKVGDNPRVKDALKQLDDLTEALK
jgi:flagellar basal body rod protein FlgC